MSSANLQVFLTTFTTARRYALPMVMLAGLIAATILMGRGQAPDQDAASCTAARSTIRIHASAQVVARNVVAITYRMTNRGAVPLTWVRLGTGGGAAMSLPPDETPVIVRSAPGWTARVDRVMPSNLVSLVWESSPGAALRAGGDLEVTVHARERRYIRVGQTDAAGRPLMPIDFGGLPFSAGSASGCWWGRTTSTWELSERDPKVAKVIGATVRPLRSDGTWHVLVDLPMREGTMRISRRPIVPRLLTSLAVSWGTAGGFSVDTSIGVGLNWTPSKYISATAQSRFGTFFFNNRTHLRSVGVDMNIPIRRRPFTEVRYYDTTYLAIGVEYFQRDVVKWKGFLEGPQWYASGRGIAVRVGIKEIQWCTLC